MKKQILVAGALTISVIAFGQKREIRKAERAFEDKNYTEAIAELKQAEASLANADEEEKAQYYLVKSEVYTASAGDDIAKMKTASEAYQKAVELGARTEEERRMSALQQNLRAALVNSAIKDQNSQNFEMASDKLYNSYMVSKKDTSDLYYAASNAVNAKKFDKALKYYQNLLDMGYDGASKEFVATNKETGEEKTFSSKSERDLMIKAGDFIKPVERMTQSKKGEVLRNMTLIYIDNGEDEKASKLMSNARKENPDDTSLMRAEANMAYKMGDKQLYSELMQNIAESDPDNPEVFYNLAVSNAEIGETEKAIEYYNRAIELKPDYASALINLAVLKLSEEESIVSEMNNLGTSSADNAKYEKLKEKRQQMYADVVPTLEKAKELRPDDPEIIRTLMNIYSQLGKDAKFKELKSRLAELEGN
ncbi:tetratricopeptide repeat protein [Marixanthomonas ophiurae]|uniref:Tetratricopeptide repeat protein n=1 Tax=Marixanthomonas ophiurae TaxID=387659 RepID=A0A3E1Q7Y7_9FLAO|nr:tetratricopeptide repeat protein [Marixanthomonas ophiurae]RFN58245.1 tetratricopeptide repeat protein [Marixanthomonas ophiurae]